ncbi:alpha/beta hydrolase [Pseudolysobacter antarcticus]|uniref:Alpha/beta hydrolase n=1 Tax=Pseudolysobacter antarcticus TaxID=2511995 RepID=A0A411HGS4_9GAMM|nr:alpha/beta hydrolase [Pseudolysobacter antarcticus]QBB69736.1 alpha/beta hydrolase [Pseudolysobacter antarcticus]
MPAIHTQKRNPFGSFCALLAVCVTAHAAGAEQPGVALDIYATASKMIDIGTGHRLNLRCSGQGTTTVMLESGATADSMAWFKVQPKLATFTRACSYDRAGLGFSDGGVMPRDVDAAATDLHALLDAAHIKRPIILVGHSLGTNIARRFADRYPTELSGLALLDPPEQNVAEFSADYAKDEAESLPARLAFVSACEKAAEKGELKHPPEALKSCLRDSDPAFSKKLNAAIHANHLRPVFWQTLASIFATNPALLDKPVAADEHHGALPLMVLSADETYADAPAPMRKALEAAREKTHHDIVATSTRGERVRITHSSHEIPNDQPDAVVEAVKKMIKAG